MSLLKNIQLLRINIIKYFFLFLFIFSCDTRDFEVYKSYLYPPDHLVLSMKVKALVKTKFEFYHNAEGHKNFTNNRCIFSEVKKETKYQNVVFKIKDDNIQSVKIDLGINELLNNVNIYSIEVYLNNKVFTIRDIEEFFDPNIFIKKQKTNQYELRVLKDKIYDVYDPYFTSNKKFIKLLKYLRVND
ncbi:MAG: hypothetical protein WA839_08250 [Flavobacteriaceae bacterium]